MPGIDSVWSADTCAWPGQPRLLPPPRLIIRYHLHSGNWDPSFVFVNLVSPWPYTSHYRQCTWGLSQSLPESCLLLCCSKYEPLKCKIITQPRHSKKRNVDRMILGENKTALKVARKRQKWKLELTSSFTGNQSHEGLGDSVTKHLLFGSRAIRVLCFSRSSYYHFMTISENIC